MSMNKYKDEKTCGRIEFDEAFGIIKIAEPVGVIAGIVPTTNPTSTAIFKSLLALKTRNAIIFSPHPRAKKSTIAAAKIVRDAAVAGQSARKIAAMAGLEVPEYIKALIAETDGVGKEFPFSIEKLSPVLAMYKAADFESALKRAQELVVFGGIGHTSVLYANPRNMERIHRFGETMKTCRTLINMPASQGAIGDVFNFKLDPSLTLGCGSWGGNSVSQNVTPKHLLNIKTTAERRENMLWFRVPEKIYFKYGCLSEALRDLDEDGRNRAFIVTDRFLCNAGMLNDMIEMLEQMNFRFKIFSDVEPNPTLGAARKGLERLNAFKPDTIITIGGGIPMDAAKIMRLLYEYPDVHFEDIAMRFMDIRKRVYRFPKLGKKAALMAIPTSSGTGSERALRHDDRFSRTDDAGHDAGAEGRGADFEGRRAEADARYFAEHSGIRDPGKGVSRPARPALRKGVRRSVHRREPALPADLRDQRPVFEGVLRTVKWST